MRLKAISFLLIALLLTNSCPQAQEWITYEQDTMCGPHANTRPACGGIAYEESLLTNQLLATIVVGSAVTALIFVALFNTPKNKNGHDHCCHRHHHCCHSHQRHHHCGH